jgi:hypothetical protein
MIRQLEYFSLLSVVLCPLKENFKFGLAGVHTGLIWFFEKMKQRFTEAPATSSDKVLLY